MQPVAVEKQLELHILSVCVCLALGVHHAMRMRLSMSSVACPAQQCLSTLSHKQHDSRGKKMLLNIKCVF